MRSRVAVLLSVGFLGIMAMPGWSFAQEDPDPSTTTTVVEEPEPTTTTVVEEPEPTTTTVVEEPEPEPDPLEGITNVDETIGSLAPSATLALMTVIGLLCGLGTGHLLWGRG